MPWLMKAEPDSRVVKGKDVKFSVDDFETLGTSQWDGVRNHEAKKIMKEKMKIGDKVLFYHSNCKVPGVYGLAEVSREGYPDYTAFDVSHPYHDPKSTENAPTWFMVDVKFVSRVKYPPTLHLIKHIASLNSLPYEINYIGTVGLKALKEMGLVNRGRLSVQPVTQEAFDAVVLLGERGGWESLVTKAAVKRPKVRDQAETGSSHGKQVKSETKTKIKRKSEGRSEEQAPQHEGLRRSKRGKV